MVRVIQQLQNTGPKRAQRNQFWRFAALGPFNGAVQNLLELLRVLTSTEDEGVAIATKTISTSSAMPRPENYGKKGIL